MNTTKANSKELEFCSLSDFTRVYFPIAHEKKHRDIISDKKTLPGTGLAVELLNNVKKKVD